MPGSFAAMLVLLCPKHHEVEQRYTIASRQAREMSLTSSQQKKDKCIQAKPIVERHTRLEARSCACQDDSHPEKSTESASGQEASRGQLL